MMHPGAMMRMLVEDDAWLQVEVIKVVGSKVGASRLKASKEGANRVGASKEGASREGGNREGAWGQILRQLTARPPIALAG